MKLKNNVILLLLVIALSPGCDNDDPSPSHDFTMRVEQVEALEGVILKGIAISGTVENGCIAKEDEFSVKRDGKEVLKEIARILKIQGGDSADGEIKKTVQGDYVSLYIPDRRAGDVRSGDVVVSDTVSCK